MRTLPLLLALALTGCALFGAGRVNWPAVVSCGIEPSSALVEAAVGALQSGGDTRAKMENLARTYGAEAVICVVRALLSPTMEAAPSGAGGSPAPGRLSSSEAFERGQAFLDSVGHPVR